MNEINLIPYELKAKRKKVKTRKTIIVSILYTLVILAVASYVPIQITTLNNKKYESLLGKKEKIEELGNKSDEILREISGIKTYIKDMDTLNKNKISMYSQIKAMQSYIKNDIKLVKIYADSKSFDIYGISENFNSINDTVNSLKKSEDYSDVIINNIADDNKGYTFNFKITLKEKQ